MAQMAQEQQALAQASKTQAEASKIISRSKCIWWIRRYSNEMGMPTDSYE